MHRHGMVWDGRLFVCCTLWHWGLRAGIAGFGTRGWDSHYLTVLYTPPPIMAPAVRICIFEVLNIKIQKSKEGFGSWAMVVWR